MIKLLYTIQKHLCYLIAIFILLGITTSIIIQYRIGNSISMHQAYHIAIQALQQQNPDVQLYTIGSNDSFLKTEDKTAGNQGLRRYWNIVFTIPDTTEHWLVGVRDKKVKDLVKIEEYPKEKSTLIDNMNSLIDSKEALKVAIQEYNLQPGEDWAIGYHYKMEKYLGIVIITVFGRDNQKNFARISINAQTKEVISAIHKVTHDGTNYEWETLNKPK